MLEATIYHIYFHEMANFKPRFKKFLQTKDSLCVRALLKRFFA